MNTIFPQLCVLIVKSEAYFFNYSIPSYELSIKFNDSKQIGQSSLFDLSYEISLYDTCGNKYNRLVKLNELFKKTGIPNGDYFIEIIPKVNSSYCLNQCPVFISKRGHLTNEVQCEDCKKIIKYIQIKNSDEKNFICFNEFDNIVDLNYIDEFRLMKFLIEHNDSSLIVTANQSILIPSILDTNQLCNRKLIVVLPKEKVNILRVFLIAIIVSITFISMLLLILLLFGYSNIFYFIFVHKLLFIIHCCR